MCSLSGEIVQWQRETSAISATTNAAHKICCIDKRPTAQSLSPFIFQGEWKPVSITNAILRGGTFLFVHNNTALSVILEHLMRTWCCLLCSNSPRYLHSNSADDALLFRSTYTQKEKYSKCRSNALTQNILAYNVNNKEFLLTAQFDAYFSIALTKQLKLYFCKEFTNLLFSSKPNSWLALCNMYTTSSAGNPYWNKL